MSATCFSCLMRVSLVLLPAISARAQVDTRVNTRVDGRLLDANNLVGSGGYNVNSVNEYPNSANLLITGNITAGRRFQGFSPIRDSSQLFINAPSASLSNFERDSIGVGDIVSGRSQSVATPFFNTSTTTSGVGGVRFPSPLTNVPALGRQYVLPRADAFTGRPIGLDPGLNPSWNVAPPAPRTFGTADPYSQTDLIVSRSPLFGLPRAAALDPIDYALPVPPVSTGLATPQSGTALPLSFPGALNRPRNLFDTTFGRAPLSGLEVPPLTGPEGAVQRDLLAAGTASVAPGRTPPVTPGVVPPSTVVTAPPEDAETLAAAESAAPSGPMAAPGGLPGFVPGQRSVYQDFQEARRWIETYNEYRAGLAEKMTQLPSVTGEYEKSMSFARTLVEAAPKSFAGQEDNPVNQRIRRAEELMRRGEFYGSAAQYDSAAALDPRNPLIALGRGHALFAAGDYLSAVQSLTRGIERFDGIDQFRINLYDFVPDPNMLDIRRADLETKLERREDYRMRFLLGYVEYYSNLEKFGLPDLKRAAADAPTDSIIARFPAMLEKR